MLKSRKIVSLMVLVTMIGSMSVTSLAQETTQGNENAVITRNSQVVVERENVSSNDAKGDKGFNFIDAQNQLKTPTPRNAHWNV